MLSRQSTRRSVLLLQRDARRLPRAGGLPAAATAAWVGAVQLLSVPSSSSLAVASVPTRQFSLSRRVSARDLSTEPAQKLNVKRLAVIGGGNMAEAVVTALASKGLIDPAGIVVSDPNPNKRKKYRDMGLQTSDRNVTAVKGADAVLLAVKPQVLDDVMDSFKEELQPSALVISVVAGVTIDGLQEGLGDGTHVIRTMPNTPAMIGEGMTVWSQSAEVTEEQHELTKGILGAFGVEVFVDDEGALDMATALSGSGPAYFFLVAEAMIDAGVHMGFSRAVATKLVQQTMIGSALYMQSSDKHPVELRNNITSPGGTTAAALYRAEKNGFRAVIADSIWAAYERCLELGSPVPVQRKRPRS